MEMAMAWIKCWFSDTWDKTNWHRTKGDVDYIHTHTHTKGRAQVETIRAETGNPKGGKTDKGKR